MQYLFGNVDGHHADIAVSNILFFDSIKFVYKMRNFNIKQFAIAFIVALPNIVYSADLESGALPPPTPTTGDVLFSDLYGIYQAITGKVDGSRGEPEGIKLQDTNIWELP